MRDESSEVAAVTRKYYEYYLNGVLLTNNACVLDLGVTISSDLSYTTHVNNIV